MGEIMVRVQKICSTTSFRLKNLFFDPIKALETIEELDKDKDGYLDLDEYLGDAKNIPDEHEKTEISDDFIG